MLRRPRRRFRKDGDEDMEEGKEEEDQVGFIFLIPLLWISSNGFNVLVGINRKLGRHSRNDSK
jgi:hypothetical protein